MGRVKRASCFSHLPSLPPPRADGSGREVESTGEAGFWKAGAVVLARQPQGDRCRMAMREGN